jgi:membrane-associated phospholipid phosphatase
MHETYLFFLSFLFLALSHFFEVLQHIDLHILEAINHNRIRPLDHFFIFITNIATVTTYSVSIILLLYSLIKKRFLLQRKNWMVFISLITTSAIIDSLKYIVNRTRPFITDPAIHNLVNVSTASFPSGHTGEVFVLATAITLLFKKQKWCILLVWIWAFLVAYTRLVLGVHYPSDVLASMVIGIGIGIGFPRFLISRGFLQHQVHWERLYAKRKE